MSLNEERYAGIQRICIFIGFQFWFIRFIRFYDATFAVSLADNIKGSCLMVSLEMTAAQITNKRISRLTGISAAKLLAGSLIRRAIRELMEREKSTSSEIWYVTWGHRRLSERRKNRWYHFITRIRNNRKHPQNDAFSASEMKCGLWHCRRIRNYFFWIIFLSRGDENTSALFPPPPSWQY